MSSHPSTQSAAPAAAAARPSLRGRPAVTSHAAIEQAAFRLFAERGFDATTLSDIAAEAGIGQRTLTRYYRSKNDIPWGQFDRTLEHFRQLLATAPDDAPLWQRVHRAVIGFNEFPDDAEPAHRERMRLILGTPTLQAHSVLQYAQWRGVIAEYVAAETGVSASDPLPRLVGHVSLALAVSAYEEWLGVPETAGPHDRSNARLLAILDRAMGSLRSYLS
ncbi:mycofactocin system transcriptional regulator [Nocardioides sp. AN3]